MKYSMILLVIVSVLLAGSGIAGAQRIVISTLEETNPVQHITEHVMMEAYERIGMTMELKRYPGERAIRTANDGDVDGELVRIAGVEEQYPNLLRVPVVVTTLDLVVFTKDNDFPVTGWDSLLPYSVGYKRGAKIVENNLVEGTTAEPVNTLEQAFKKLNARRTDVVLDLRFAGLGVIKTLELQDIEVLEPPLVTIPIYHYLHVKNQHLVEPLTAALQEMEADGTIQKIREQVIQEWFDEERGDD